MNDINLNVTQSLFMCTETFSHLNDILQQNGNDKMWFAQQKERIKINSAHRTFGKIVNEKRIGREFRFMPNSSMDVIAYGERRGCETQNEKKTRIE